MSNVQLQSLNVSKEQEQAFPGVFLFQIALVAGPILFLCSASDGQNKGLNNGGHFYAARITDQSIQGIQAMSSQGVDVVGAIQIDIADADQAYLAYENQYGFQGATLTVIFVLWDPLQAGAYSPDNRTLFTGICDPITRTAKYDASKGIENAILTLRATSSNNYNKRSLPPSPIQRTCINQFPTTAARRIDGASNFFSPYFMCGYSPDVNNAFGRGNYNGPNGPFPSCGKTVQDCQARGMYNIDVAGRSTKRFNASQWDPPATWKGKSFTAGKTTIGINSINVQKWSQYKPLTFGTTWVTGIPLNVVGDPNSTRAEVCISDGSINTAANDAVSAIRLVLVNNLLTPRWDQTDDLLFRWYLISDGGRNGGINATEIYNSTGDPNGSSAVIMPIVYSQVQQSNSNPNVQVLLSSRAIPVWQSPTSWTAQRNDLVAWVALEILRIVRPDQYAQIDIQSVIDYASHCGEAVTYTNLYGKTATHRRYGVSATIAQKTAAGAILAGLRMTGKLMIVPNGTGTQLRFVGKRTLADQQPRPIAGSNYSTPIVSYKVKDNPLGSPTGTGYAAYSFDESNIIRGSLQLVQDGIDKTPDVMVAQIQDEDNDWTQDTVTVGDPIAYARIQQVVESSLPSLGFPNYDQAFRCLQTQSAELFRGNPRGDSGGTWRFQFTSTQKVAHLNQGDIVVFSNAVYGLNKQLFRVESLSPSRDFRTATVGIRWMDDRWFTDGYGQGASPYFSSVGEMNPARPPFFWMGNQVTSHPGDPIYSWNGFPAVTKTFDLLVGVDLLRDGSVLPEVQASGQCPLNKPVQTQAPRIDYQGVWLTTGGHLPDAITLYAWVSAFDAQGNEGPVQARPCITPVPGAFGKNSVQIPVLGWPSWAAGWNLYTSTVPYAPVLDSSGYGLPTSVTATANIIAGQGPPDPKLDHLVFRTKRLISPGWLLVGPGIGGQNTVTPNTITFNYAYSYTTQSVQPVPIATGALNGYLLMCVWQGDGTSIPYFTFKVFNSSGNLVVMDPATGNIDLTTLDLTKAWFIALHKIDSVAGPVIHAQNNTFGPGQLLVGCHMRILEGPGYRNVPRTIIAADPATGNITLDAPFPVPPIANATGTTKPSVIVIEESAWRTVVPHARTVNSSRTAQIQLKATFPNVPGQAWYCEVGAADAHGNETPLSRTPYRIFSYPGTSGQSVLQGLNLISNPDFENVPTPHTNIPDWNLVENDGQAWNVYRDTSNPYSGQYSIRFDLAAGTVLQTGQTLNALLASTGNIAIPKPGEIYYLSLAGFFAPSSGFNAGMLPAWFGEIYINYSDGSVDNISAAPPPPYTRNVWVIAGNKGTINPNKIPTSINVSIGVYMQNTAPNAYAMPILYSMWIDHVSVVRALDLGNEITGASLSGVIGTGNIIPSTGITINVTTNSNSSGSCTIGLTWPSGQTVQRSDGSLLSIQAGSATWNGLSANTKYYFYPYALAKDGSVHFGSGDPPATPPAAQSMSASAASYADGNFPFPVFNVTTPASSGGSGSGSGGGGAGVCPEANELVCVADRGVVKAGEIVAGDLIRGVDFETGVAVFRRVRQVQKSPSTTWRIVDGCRVSPMHAVSKPTERRWEFPYRIGTHDTFAGVRVEITVEGREHDQQNYSRVNEDGQDVLILHNYFVSC